MDNKQLKQEIAKLDELREKLIGRLQQKDGITALEEAQVRIEPGSPEHEAMLASGYDMTKAQAEAIIKEREERPERWPYEMLVKAQAFLAALDAKPQVISTRQPWRIRAARR